MRVLIIEDDQATSAYIQKGLLEAGHQAEVTPYGDAGLRMASDAQAQYQALIVDRMLPNLDGLSLISKLRETGNKTPALVLSALGEVNDRVAGLRAGGDDYLSKPFAFSELLARLEALARRATTAMMETPQTTLTVGELKMDLLRREVTRGETAIHLQPLEFRLLEYLMQHSDQVVTRAMLQENVWHYNFDPQTSNVIDVHISRLRSKIDKNFSASLLTTVRGAGYILSETKA